MKVSITSSSIRTMADRVVKTHADVSKPKALEILSSGFGYKNFDTLSGILKKGHNATMTPGAIAEDGILEIPEFTPFMLVVEAFACDEYCDSPLFAQSQITPEFLQKIVQVATLCNGSEIRVAHLDDDDGVWADHGNEDDPLSYLNMRGTDLVVMPSRGALQKTSIFWHGHPKHASYNCETRAFCIDNLLACIGNTGVLPDGFRRERGVLFYSGDPGAVGYLIEQYFDEEGGNVDGIQNGDEVWWFDPADDLSSGLYTVVDASHPDVISLINEAGSNAEVMPNEIVKIDRDDVAEWVGLHYSVNFDAEPSDRQIEWIGRWAQSQYEGAMPEHTGEWVIYHCDEQPEARFWSNEDGWTSLDGATRFTEMPMAPYPFGGPKNNQAAALCIGTMQPYTVVVAQNPMGKAFAFEGFANDADHAVEQALKAYPGFMAQSVQLTESIED